MNKQRKVLYKNYDSLTNHETQPKDMIVKPPSKNNNCDQAIFSNILTIKQSNVMNNIPIFKVGHPKDEVEIEIDDSKLD